MKNNKNPKRAFELKRCAFSLIEILVSLIIISLLVGAFTPVVTKKLKSSDITVGSFGTAVTSDDCDQFSSQDHKCIMCTTSSCSLCTSQMNLAGGFYVDPADNCDPKECKDKFGNDCMGCNKDKCTTCLSTATLGYYRDPDNNCIEEKCSDKFGDNCSACNKDACISCVSGSGYNTLTNTCETCSSGYYSPGGSAKCEKCSSGSVSTQGASSCTECSAANHKVANAEGTACVDKNCPPGEYIDGVTCKTCFNGTYKLGTNQNGCSPCSSTCGTCDKKNGDCLSCISGYTLSSNKTCTLGCDPQTVTLSGTTTQVTRFNMGDDPQCPRSIIASKTGVTFVPVGASCTGDYCCWYGQTATTACTDKSGGIYSGCNRTVCNWYAADKICKSIGEGWSLPATSAYMANWYPTNSTATTGLMLCDWGTSSTKASKCPFPENGGTCLGAVENRCLPHIVWSAGVVTGNSNNRQNIRLVNNVWKQDTKYLISNALSVRCVKE